MTLWPRQWTPWFLSCVLSALCLGSPASSKGDDTGAFDWVPPSDWPAASQVSWSRKSLVDYLVWSEDGKTLCGKSQNQLVYDCRR